jgi:squalene synthase HpnC
MRLYPVLTQQKSTKLKPLRPPLKSNRDKERPKATFKLRRAQFRCLRLALKHYENFIVLGPLTPLRLLPHLAALYAFCRFSDDLADEIKDRDLAARKMDEWEQELKRALEGSPRHPIARALAWTAAKYNLPAELLFDLLSAFRQDLNVNRYGSFAELRDYTRRSADPVGRLVLRLCGDYDSELEALSDSICTGLQLANFCQDVGDDARRDRLYIPLDECALFNVDPDDLLNRNQTPQIEKLLRYQAVRAYKLLQAGASLPEHLSGKFRLSVRLFILGGMRILDNVQEGPLLAMQHRVKLTLAQKIATLIVARKTIPAKILAEAKASG